MNRNIVTFEEVKKRAEDMPKSSTWIDTVRQCFFEKGWSVCYFYLIKWKFDIDAYELRP